MKKNKKRNDVQKMTGTWIVILVAVISELLLYTRCRVQYVRIGYEISREIDRQQHLVVLQKNLRIELARLKSPERIARIARQQLGLIMPDSDQVIMIQ